MRLTAEILDTERPEPPPQRVNAGTVIAVGVLVAEALMLAVAIPFGLFVWAAWAAFAAAVLATTVVVIGEAFSRNRCRDGGTAPLTPVVLALQPMAWLAQVVHLLHPDL
ncbi:hypothetical protein [Kineococcus sp. NUM-3379]